MARDFVSCIFSAALFFATQVGVAAWPYTTFVTEPFQPPVLNITTTGSPAPGYMFVGPRGEQANGTAAVIYDGSGNLVWQSADTVTSNFIVQRLNGEPVLTYWDGNMMTIGYGYGVVHVLDSSYTEIHTVNLTTGNYVTPNVPNITSFIDLHESQMTVRNTMLVTAYNTTQTDLTSVGGAKDGWILAATFNEIDVATNDVVFTWNVLDHLDEIPLAASHQALAGTGQNQTVPWDAFHINSVAQVNNGYIVSLRHLWRILYIGKDGSVIWQLDGAGKAGNFTLGQGCNFSWQHHVRAFEESCEGVTLSVFDNAQAVEGLDQNATLGLVLSINYKSKMVKSLRTLNNAASPLYSWSQGSIQLFDGNLTGNVYMDYGSSTVVREYDSSNNMIMSAQFGDINTAASYRGFKFQWTGKPTWKPAVVAKQASSSSPSSSANNMTVYMSWNGATEYDNWQIYGGPSQKAVKSKLLARVPRHGFESNATIPYGGDVNYIAAVARKGALPLGTSEAISVSS